MEADPSAPVYEMSEIEVDAPPEVVWDTLTDLESWPQWNPGVKSVSVKGPVATGTRFEWKAGPGKIRSEIVAAARPHVVAWKGRTTGISAIHGWRIEGLGPGRSGVHTAESWAGLLPRVLKGPMGNVVRRAIDDGLPALKEEAERRARTGGSGA